MRYTKQEEKLIQKMYHDYYSVEEIAEEINRTPITLLHKIKRMNLPARDKNLIRLIYVNGRGILKYGKSAPEVRAAIEAERKEKIKFRATKAQLAEELAIKQLKSDLKHKIDRKSAARAAFKAGAKLASIGDVLGMTKQGVSWMIKNSPKGKS